MCCWFTIRFIGLGWFKGLFSLKNDLIIKKKSLKDDLRAPHDMIEIWYDMKMDKDRKWYRHDKHLSYRMFDTHMITNIISYISQLNDKITIAINYVYFNLFLLKYN